MGQSPLRHLSLILFFFFTISGLLNAQQKPKLTLDEFFNWVEISNARLSPDGNTVLITTSRPDWDQQIYREELWLYRIPGAAESNAPGNLIQLTQSG
ncbi:MAG: hypothetical protein WB817_05225, partial [Terriglobales bacterium]